jgi:hypothetical protein
LYYKAIGLSPIAFYLLYVIRSTAAKLNTEEEVMVDQQLLTDLVLAEMNIRKMIKISKISFNDVVRKTFMEYEVNSFYDLIKFDELKALELREIAKKERLI